MGLTEQAAGGLRQQVVPSRLRGFCLFSAIQLLGFAVCVAALRPVVVPWQIDAGPYDAALVLVVQELLCAAGLAWLAGLLLWVRSAIGTQPWPVVAGRARAARNCALVIGLLVFAGLVAVLVLPVGESRFPTFVISVWVDLTVVPIYSGLRSVRP